MLCNTSSMEAMCSLHADAARPSADSFGNTIIPPKVIEEGRCTQPCIGPDIDVALSLGLHVVERHDETHAEHWQSRRDDGFGARAKEGVSPRVVDCGVSRITALSSRLCKSLSCQM